MPSDSSLRQRDVHDSRLRVIAGLQRQHAIEGTAQTAHELAKGLWLTGEYGQALRFFTEARDKAPSYPALHLALMRCAAALDRPELDRSATQQALATHPHDPGICLHHALRQVPTDCARVIEILQPHQALPLHAQYFDALLHIEQWRLPPPRDGDPGYMARHESLQWAMAHVDSKQRFSGLPSDVLRRGLEAAPTDGITLECGVYFGRSLGQIARRTQGTVHGFDSFLGLPEQWKEGEPAGAYSTAGRLPEVPGNVELHAGWFEDTLPRFFAGAPGPVRLLHVDCDIYSSTKTVLSCTAPRLRPGSIVVFDDLLGYPGYRDHELRAFEELVALHGVEWEIIAACLLGREVAIRITAMASP